MRMGFIYFAEIPRMGAIKIGWSMDPLDRLRRLITEFGPATIIGVVANRSVQFETRLHKKLVRFRLTPVRCREVYADSLRLRRIIARMNPKPAKIGKMVVSLTLTRSEMDRLDAAVERRRIARPGYEPSRASVLREFMHTFLSFEEEAERKRLAS